MIPLRTHLLRANRPPLLRTRRVLRVGLPPLAGLHAHIGPLLPDRVHPARADPLQAAPLLLLLPAVRLGASHAGSRVAHALVHVGAGGARDGGRGGGARAGALGVRVEGLARRLGDVVGPEGRLGGGAARGCRLGVEFGVGVLANVDGGVVLCSLLFSMLKVSGSLEKGVGGSLTPLVVRGSSRGRREWNSPCWAMDSGFLLADIVVACVLCVGGCTW